MEGARWTSGNNKDILSNATSFVIPNADQRLYQNNCDNYDFISKHNDMPQCRSPDSAPRRLIIIGRT
jgi:hypothetical protein